jgi:hypothetical protein
VAAVANGPAAGIATVSVARMVVTFRGRPGRKGERHGIEGVSSFNGDLTGIYWDCMEYIYDLVGFKGICWD